MSQHAQRCEVRVRYIETDQMGIAHHANYLAWFELARVEFLRSRGYRYRDLEERDVRLAVIDARCRYRSPARYDDLLVVHTRLVELRRFKIRFAYRIERAEDQCVLAEGETVLGSLGPEGRPRPLPGDVMDVLRMAVDPHPDALSDT